MKKILILLFSLFFLSSPSVFAETYVCSQELGRFGRAGEVETSAYKRVGKYFIPNYVDVRFQISHESKSNLILTVINESEPFMGVVFINKDTKEFGQIFLSMEKFRKDKHNPVNHGKCVIVQ